MSIWAFRGAWPLGFDCLITYDSSIDCYVEAVTVTLVDHFSWDPLVDISFEMMTNSSNRVSRVRGIEIIMTLFQASWFSQMGCETLSYSWFDHSDSLTEHLLRLIESLLDPFSGSRFAMTCHTRAFFSSSFPHDLAFRAVVLIYSVVHSEPPYLHNLAFRAISSQLWRSKPLFSFLV